MPIHILQAEGIDVEDARQIFAVGEKLRPSIDRPVPQSSPKRFFQRKILPRLNSLAKRPRREGHLGRALRASEVAWLEREFLEDYNTFDTAAALRLAEEINRSWAAIYPRVYVALDGLEATVIVALYGIDGEYQWRIRLRADTRRELMNAVGHSAVEIVAIAAKILFLVLAIAGLKGGSTAGDIAKAMIKNPKIMGVLQKIIDLLKGGAFTFATLAELLMDLILFMAGDEEIWAALKGLVGGYFKLLGLVGRLLGRLAPGVGIALTIAAIAGPLLSLLSEFGVKVPAWLLAITGQDPSSGKPPSLPPPKEPSMSGTGAVGSGSTKEVPGSGDPGGSQPLKNLLPGGRTRVQPEW